MLAPVLPVEVWCHILKNVPKLYLPQMLGVCSLFHDIAISLLFRSIKIYFIGPIRGQNMLNSDWIEHESERLMTKSWELLNHISHDSQFAKGVKEISVIAFGDGLSIYERMTLANALLFIPDLQSFRWIGCCPSFDAAEALSLPSGLRKLEIQSTLPVESLKHLTNLECLHLSIPWFYPDDEEAHDRWTLDDELMDLHSFGSTDHNVFQISMPQLTSLRIEASQIRGIPIRILGCLLELEIFWVVGSEDESVGLDLVFHHVASLRSLTLIGFLDPGIFSFLASTSVSRLTSFRMSWEPTFSPFFNGHHVHFLCTFLQKQQSLRRLYLRIPIATLPDNLEIWNTVGTLTGLEVVGLHTGNFYFQEPDIRELFSKLPPKIKSLHLAVYCDMSSLVPLVDAIAKFQDLTFIHLYDIVSRLPVLLEDLATESRGLQMIGLNRSLWYVDRMGTDILTNKWPRWKIKFCTVADFLCEDDAWLFKYA